MDNQQGSYYSSMEVEMGKELKEYRVQIVVSGQRHVWTEELTVHTETSKKAREIAKDDIKEQNIKCSHLKRTLSCVIPVY
jgi:hypothetical protein